MKLVHDSPVPVRQISESIGIQFLPVTSRPNSQSVVDTVADQLLSMPPYLSLPLDNILPQNPQANALPSFEQPSSRNEISHGAAYLLFRK